MGWIILCGQRNPRVRSVSHPHPPAKYSQRKRWFTHFVDRKFKMWPRLFFSLFFLSFFLSQREHPQFSVDQSFNRYSLFHSLWLAQNPHVYATRTLKVYLLSFPGWAWVISTRKRLANNMNAFIGLLVNWCVLFLFNGLEGQWDSDRSLVRRWLCSSLSCH